MLATNFYASLLAHDTFLVQQFPRSFGLHLNLAVCAPAAWPIIFAYISIQSGKKKVGDQRSAFADNTMRAVLDAAHQAWLNASHPEAQAIFAEQVWQCFALPKSSAGCLAATPLQ